MDPPPTAMMNKETENINEVIGTDRLETIEMTAEIEETTATVDREEEEGEIQAEIVIREEAEEEEKESQREDVAVVLALVNATMMTREINETTGTIVTTEIILAEMIVIRGSFLFQYSCNIC